MNSLGEQRRLPILNVTEGDVGVLVGIPLTCLLATSLIGVDALVVPALLGGLVVSAAVVTAAPSHRTAWAWLRDVARYYGRRPRVTLLATADSDHDATTGGLTDYTPFTPEESTQELTGIKQAWPGAGAIERADGAVEGFLAVHPANMDMAMSGDWQQVQETAAEFANTELDFPLTLHATTRSFPAGDLVAQLDDRLNDPDVEANPQLQALLEGYRERRPAELADTQQVHYYLGVTVQPAEVRQRRQAERTPGEQLARLPVIGMLAAPVMRRQAGRSQREREAAMLERLDGRLRTVRSEFIEDVSGWSATRLSTLELFTLGAEFWTGTEYEDGDAETLLREEPAVGATRRGATTGGDGS
jgi:hypothetical protein